MEEKDKVENSKNRQFLLEGILGLVVLVVLIITAVWLIVRKNNVDEEANTANADTVMTDVIETDAEAISDAAVATDNPDSDSDAANETKNVKVKRVLVKDELSPTYVAGKALEYIKDDYQLPELFDYWNAYELDAVEDVVRLERMREITDSLGQSNDYYYFGQKDADGLPSGKGLAVYAYNTYYFGDFKAGKRDGEGMWLRVFIDEPGVVNGIKGVSEHQYSGAFVNDYPCGEGQENIMYAENAEINEDTFAIHNAIGTFKDGYYDGDMYIMTDNGDGNTTDWYGTAQRGCFTMVEAKKGYAGKIAIWNIGDGYETDEQNGYRWIMPGENLDFGIAGLKQ